VREKNSMLSTLTDVLNVSAGLRHRSVSRFALWIVAFLTLIIRKHGTSCWRNGTSYILARLRLPLEIGSFKYVRKRASLGDPCTVS
jgi:hypothetical protein